MLRAGAWGFPSSHACIQSRPRRRIRRKSRMKKLPVVFGAALLAGSAFAATAWAGDDLTVVSWGGAYSMSQHKAFIEPYDKAGNKVTEAEYNGEVAKIKAMVEAKAVTWAVIDVDTPTG